MERTISDHAEHIVRRNLLQRAIDIIADDMYKRYYAFPTADCRSDRMLSIIAEIFEVAPADLDADVEIAFNQRFICK